FVESFSLRDGKQLATNKLKIDYLRDMHAVPYASQVVIVCQQPTRVSTVRGKRTFDSRQSPYTLHVLPANAVSADKYPCDYQSFSVHPRGKIACAFTGADSGLAVLDTATWKVRHMFCVLVLSDSVMVQLHYQTPELSQARAVLKLDQVTSRIMRVVYT